MHAYDLAHVDDATLVREFPALIAQERTSTAALIAHIAEIDARRLYAPAGYPSMHAYCVEEFHMSEDAAFKRIQAGRAARACPALFHALADGRLHLTAVVLLAPHATPENVDEFIAATAHRRKAEITRFLAQKFPEEAAATIALRPVAQVNPDQATCQLVPEPVEKGAPNHPELSVPQQVAPVTSVMNFQLHFTIDQATYDKLRYVQALLSHSIPSGDVAKVFGRALDLTIQHCERRKFAATTQPRPGRPRSSKTRAANPRSIPAHVRREVWVRDQGRCTFISEKGHRCQATRRLEFDHIVPVALGGEATVDNMRLRCRAHNQYEAERAFGSAFMNAKRARAAVERVTREDTRAVISGLRNLGCRADEARLAAEHAVRLPGATTLEERLRAALRFLRSSRHGCRQEAAPVREPQMAAV